MLRKRVLLVLLAVAALAMPLSAQLPRVRKIDQTGNLYDIRMALARASFTRLITVDSSGMGDFSTLTAALAYVSTQTRSVTSQWLVLVYPGSAATAFNYTEGCMDVPSYTQVRGVMGATHDGVHGRILIDLTCTATSAAILLGTNASLVDLALAYRGVNVSSPAVISVPTVANLTRIFLNHTPAAGSAAIPALLIPNGGTITGTDVRIFATANMGAVPVISFTGTGGGSLYLGRVTGGSGCTAAYGIAGTGTVRLFGMRSDGSCTVDIDSGSAGSTVEISGGAYKATTGPSASGTGTLRNLLAPVGGSTLPTTCFPGATYVDNVTPRACWCTALNTWKCASIS